MRKRIIISLGLAASLLMITAGILLFTGKPKDDPVHPPLPPLRSIVLHDVQGLWGGQTLWATKGSVADVQIVGHSSAGKPGLWAKRYRLELTDSQWKEIEGLAGTADAAHFSAPTRKGLPDEAHPIVLLVTQAGQVIKMTKWAGDKNPLFDPLYELLLNYCRQAEKLQPTSEETFNWGWRPDGFPSPY